jgi:hypothetical protein
MGRMKYGPKFGQGAVNAGYRYNANHDLQQKIDRQRMAAIFANMPLHKRELLAHKNGLLNTARAQKRDNGATAARQEAERHAAEAVRQAVKTLEFAIAELVEHPIAKKNYRCLVNQIGIINAAILLKTKCGVLFEDRGVDLKRTKEELL